MCVCTVSSFVCERVCAQLAILCVALNKVCVCAVSSFVCGPKQSLCV